MTNHNWTPIDLDDDPSLMCTVCCQCQCCETPSEECPGAWVPIPEDDAETRDFLDEWGGIRKNR